MTTTAVTSAYAQLMTWSGVRTLGDGVDGNAVPPQCVGALLRADGGDFRWRDDGVSPTASSGMVLADGDSLFYDASPLSALRLVRAGASGSLLVDFRLAAPVRVTVGSVPVSVSPASVPDPTQGSVYAPQTVAAAGGTGPYTFSALGVPAGMSLSSSGVFSGTPTAAGAYSMTVTAADALGATGSVTVTGTVQSGVPSNAVLAASGQPALVSPGVYWLS